MNVVIKSKLTPEEIRTFCSFRNAFSIPKHEGSEERTLVKRVIATFTNRECNEVNSDVIYDEFMTIKKKLIKKGLNK